jgi:hypothetical protein
MRIILWRTNLEKEWKNLDKMNWLNKLLGIKPKGEFEVVFSKSGTWDIKIGKDRSYNEYCHFDILYNDVTKKYKLVHRGHNPEGHSLYSELFKWMRKLNEGTYYVKGGEIYETNPSKTNGKDVSSMNETECQAYLNKAIQEEDYELADKLRKRLEKFR